MNPFPLCFLFLGLVLAHLFASTSLCAGQALPEFPMAVPQERSAATHRAAKPALDSRRLDDMEDLASWTAFGPGTMTLSAERSQSGKHSLRLTSPTKLDKPGPVAGRPFAETGVRRTVPSEDWSDFNRLSFHVYPHLPGFRNISLMVKFHAAGSDRWSYTFGQLHFVLLKPDQWNHVVWEIPHLPRTHVTAIDLIYRLQGNEPAATNTVQFDFDNLRLERVAQPDHFEGWNVAPDRIAYCHLGYLPSAAKVALALPGADSFQIRPAAGGDPLLAGPAETRRTPLGTFARLDFTSLRQPGRYVLQYGGLLTPPFEIGPGAWNPALIATLNQYACQRCGDLVPGIHDVCHRDWQVAHGDRRINLDGGWHDAGDLSQGLVNTSEAVTALIHAAEGFERVEPALSRRFGTEALWGLHWIQRTRFSDGFRAIWATMDFWTDGILGTPDDVTARAGDSAFDILLASQACASASRFLKTSDPIAAAHSLRLAEADWRHASRRLESGRTDLTAAAIVAALEIFRASGSTEFREQAIELGRRLCANQQTTPPTGWSVPLSGFFYADASRRRTLRYNHRSHEDSPVIALCGLARDFPDHPDAPTWRSAVRKNADFLRQTAELNSPWDIPAAGIYSATEGDESSRRQVREGIPLDDTHFLRRFPVWGDFRGNSGVLLSQARALSAAAALLRDARLAQLARSTLEWHLGRNPFCQSLMYGVGHDFTPQYTAMSGDITGGLPVGIQTRLDQDVPYWPASNCFNFAEIWIHCATRFLSVLTDLETGIVHREP